MLKSATANPTEVSAPNYLFPATAPVQTGEREIPVRILSVSADAADHLALRRLLAGVPCQIASSGTCRGALQHLIRGGISVVICEANLPDGTWLDILNDVQSSRERPLLIVTSRFADEYLWAEVLNLGGFDVIAKPFQEPEVRHIVESARLSTVETLRFRAASSA
jgi:DNA-binding NtrC family response regulator